MKKILVIEDDSRIRKIIDFHLQKSGYNVRSAENGKIGLELFEADKPDMILLDIMMPVMNGNEFCRELLSKYPDNGTPIIILSAKNDVDQIFESYSNGVIEYLNKPFKVESLLEVMKNFFTSKSNDAEQKNTYRPL